MSNATLENTSGEVVGVVVEVDPSYTRQIAIGWLVLLPILAAAGVAQLVLVRLAALLRSQASPGRAPPKLKDRRRGPEVVVTPFSVRQAGGDVVELELHGHLASSALLARDRVIAAVRPQGRPELPPRAHRIDNYSSG